MRKPYNGNSSSDVAEPISRSNVQKYYQRLDHREATATQTGLKASDATRKAHLLPQAARFAKSRRPPPSTPGRAWPAEDAVRRFSSRLTRSRQSGSDVSEAAGFFPAQAASADDARKRKIKIRQMLEMRAGYPWEETEPRLWQVLGTGVFFDPVVEFALGDTSAQP